MVQRALHVHVGMFECISLHLNVNCKIADAKEVDNMIDPIFIYKNICVYLHIGKICKNKLEKHRARQMTQKLRTLLLFQRTQVFNPSTNKVAYTLLKCYFQGYLSTNFWSQQALCACGIHDYME